MLSVSIIVKIVHSEMADIFHIFGSKWSRSEIGNVCSVILSNITCHIWNNSKWQFFVTEHPVPIHITLDHSQWSWFVCPPSSPLLDWQVLCWFHTKIALWSIRFFNLLLLLFRCHIYSYYEIRWFKHCKYLFRWSYGI